MINNNTELHRIVYFDYSACIILVVILVSTIMRRMTKGRLNRYFLVILITSLITTVADSFSVYHDNMLYDNVTVRMLESTLYLLFHVLTPPLFCVYVTEITDTRHILVRNKAVLYGVGLPYILVTLAIIANLFIRKVFYIDDSFHYIRGEWFWVLYVCAVFYIGYMIYFLVRYRRSVGLERWVSLVVLLCCMLTAVLIQYLYPRYPIEMFSTAIGLLFISVMVQRPEEILDVESGAKSRNAFAEDIGRSFDNNKSFDLIILKISNLHSFDEILSFDKRTGLLKETRERADRIALKHGVIIETYYLRSGVFAFTVDEWDRGLTDQIAHELYEEAQKPIEVSNMLINLITYCCVICCPKDMNEKEALSEFINKAIPAESGVSRAEDILASGKYDMIIDMDSIISRAISENNFEVYYQPIYSINERRFNSAEALIRLKDEKYGFVPPDVFIPEAERSGAIHKIGKFVLESVCGFIASDEFKELDIDYIEINLSVVQCMSETLADEIIELLDRLGIAHDRINLEITETFAAHKQSVMEANIKKLTDAGISFSLDDFGTGYSNMQSIALLPLAITKLDKTFASLEDNEKMTVVVERSIDMIKALEMKIVVEGVETKEMLERFSSLGCEYIQGYYFSKPLPKKEFIEFILAHKKG